MSYLSKSIRDIHNAIIDNRITPLELVKEALQLAKNDDNNAFEYICEKEAIKKVDELDISKKNSLLYGIPVVIKDNFSTKDIPTTGSCDMLKNYVPIFSSEVVNRLEQAGAIVIGKTTLDALAMGGRGTASHLGITYNPWDKTHTRIIGGSSCGSAAAISAGIVPLAIGSDTGDSVRKPANYAGCVGFKPTWGRISRFGLFPFATSLDHVAYFTRNVFDSALTLSVLAGRDDKDYSSSFKEVDDYVSDIDKDIKNTKIAVIKPIIDSIKNENIVNEFNKTVNRLRQDGVVVDYIDFDINLLRAILPTYMVISSAEAGSNNASLDGIKFGVREDGSSYEEIVKNSRTKGLSSLVKRRFVIGGYALLEENQNDFFLRAQKCRRLIVNAFNKIFEKYDAIYCPASSSTAPLIDNKNVDHLSDEYLIAENYLAFGNMGGYPSITLPIGFENDLPFGANITCKPFEEKKLLNIAFNIEKITGLKDLVAKENN